MRAWPSSRLPRTRLSATRRHVLAPLLVLLGTATAVLGPASAASASGDTSSMISRTEASRAANGLRPLRVCYDLNSVAAGWAAHMASQRAISHNPNLASSIGGWSALAENVGVAASTSQMQQTLMASSEHRSHILSTTYTEIGIGTSRDSAGRLYVDEVFRRPSGGACAGYTPTTTSSTASTTGHVGAAGQSQPVHAVVDKVAIARAAWVHRVRVLLHLRPHRGVVSQELAYSRGLGLLTLH